MSTRYTIPISVLFAVVAALCVGELASGTSPAFVAMMSVTFLCIGITYNFLGGLTTFSGIVFAMFAVRTIVLSQFVKVLILEPADKNLEAPLLTIGAYMVFYFSAMVGTLIYGRVRIKLPKPLEPSLGSQSDLVYWVALVAGLAATFIAQSVAAPSGGGTQDGGAHSLGLAFSGLLLFSLVIAVDSRIRETKGAHSFGLKAIIPAVSLAVFSFFNTSRNGIILPLMVYFIACFLRGYRFKQRHYVTAVAGALAFYFLISPFELFSRRLLVVNMPLSDRVFLTVHQLATLPSWSLVLAATSSYSEGASSESREEYFSPAGTRIFSRLSVIRFDSNMIGTCAGGYHYGWTSIRTDLLRNIPALLTKEKPEEDSAAFTGRVTGLNADTGNGEVVLGAIGDVFGGFGWWGVVLFPLFALPALFIIVESMFDIRLPWGTAALGLFINIPEWRSGIFLANTVRFPVTVLLGSYVVVGILRLLPARRDR